MLKKIKIKNIIMLTLAGIVNACGITLFLNPVGLYDSGISGTSMLLSSVTPVSLSIFLLALNIPLFLFGLKKQGGLFTIYAIYTVGIYSLFAYLITNVFSIDFTFGSPIAKMDLLLCAIFGGVISGIGSGLAIRFGGAMDGIEVMAVIFAKRLNITVGTFCMVYNVLIYIIAGLIFNSWIVPLYSMITYYAGLKVIDAIVDGLDKARGAMIVTTKPDEICDALSNAFECGATTIAAKGSYSKSDKVIVYFVVNRFQVTKMTDIVHEIDSMAYITLSEISDVFHAE